VYRGIVLSILLVRMRLGETVRLVEVWSRLD
jgi:hypothetical protein